MKCVDLPAEAKRHSVFSDLSARLMKFRIDTIRVLPNARVLVLANDEVRFGGRSAFEYTVVVGVFLDDVQCLG